MSSIIRMPKWRPSYKFAVHYGNNSSAFDPLTYRCEAPKTLNAPAFGLPVAAIQVLSNLIVNALEASGPGNVVTIATDTTGHRTLIHVIDHGSGIPTALITRVFEPFFTTKSNGS